MSLLLFTSHHAVDQFSDWAKLAIFDQVELPNEEDEVFEARIQVCLLAKSNDNTEVVAVDMSVYPEYALRHLAN